MDDSSRDEMNGMDDGFRWKLDAAMRDTAAPSRAAAAREDAAPLPLRVVAEGGPGAGGRGYGHGDAYNTSDDERHLMDFFRVLYRRRWPAVTVFTVVCLVGLLLITSGPPVYEARAQLMIENELPNVASFRNLEQPQVGYVDESFLETQFKILQSRGLARRTLEALQLWDTPPFGGPPPAVPAWSVRRMVGAAIRAPRAAASALARATGLTTPPPPKAPDESEAQARAVDTLMAALTVTPVRNSRLVDVKARMLEPALAAKLANGLAAEYIRQNLEFRFTTSRDTSDWLEGRMAEQRRRVEESEQALQRYREENNAVSLEERQNIVVQKLADLNAAVTKAKTERIQKESLYRQVQQMEADPALFETLPTILANSYIQKLKEEQRELQRQEAQFSAKLGDMHPEMLKVRSATQTVQARLDAEIRKVTDGIRNEYQAALSQERSLTQVLEQQKGEAMELNRQSVDYAVLLRDAENNRKLFDQLQEQAKVTGISSEMNATNIRVVDPAEAPRRPLAPTGATWLVILLGASLAAVGVAAFLEYLDNRVKLPEEIEAALGIPFLGLVPLLPNPGRDGRAPLVDRSVPSAFVEAIRMVRTNILFASAEPGSRTLLVTSPTPGEGKTMTSSNLAVALAQAGQTVLLIDADLRRPQQHEVFEQARTPGLSDVLVGAARAGDAIRKAEQRGLWVLPAGHGSPDPTELLNSATLSRLLASVVEHFEWVVLDAPPVLAVADASILANRVSSVILVVGAEMTTRQAARRAVEQLQAAKAKISGGILNRANVTRHAYYYSHYYGRGYGRYYTADTPPRPAAPPKRASGGLGL